MDTAEEIVRAIVKNSPPRCRSPAGHLGLAGDELRPGLRVRLGPAAHALGAPGLQGSAPRVRRRPRAAVDDGRARTADMDFGFTREEEDFRKEVLDFLADYQDLQGYFHRGDHTGAGPPRPPTGRLGERGWLSLSWPEEFGGGGLSPPTSSSCGTRWLYACVARPPMAPAWSPKP
ncbi:acyl-CoA dehydrogenase family protein [Yinghuangia aomiensis]